MDTGIAAQQLDEGLGARCRGRRKDGSQCKGTIALVEGLCGYHRGLVDPGKARVIQIERRRSEDEALRAAAARSRLAPRDQLALAIAEKWGAIQAVLLDGAIAEGDRPTLIRLMSEAFGRPTETVQLDGAGQGEELPLEALVALWEREVRGVEAGTPVAQGGEQPQ